MRKKWSLWLSFPILILLLMQPRATWGQPIGDDTDLMLDYVVGQSLQRTVDRLRLSAIDADLRVADAHVVQIEDLGFTSYAVKIHDIENGTIDIYWYDAEGKPTTEREAFDVRAAAYEEKYGHLSRGLYARLAESSVSGVIPVAVWAEQAVGTNVPTPDLPFEVYLPSVLRVGTTLCNKPVECIVQFVESRGYSVDYISSEAPVVYADLPTALINDLQRQNFVAAIYEQSINQTTLYSAGRTSAAPWTWAQGITGSGIKVAVLEVPELCGTGGSAVATSNPYVSASDYYRDGARVSNHATAVAGVIASEHSTERGIAYGATILSANSGELGIENDIISVADWAIGAGADVINASFGTSCGDLSVTSQDKYFDWVVWEKRKTVVVAAGNLLNYPKPSYCPESLDWSDNFCPANYNVSSPGKAYNVITVGSKNDNNTAEVESDTKDDFFSSFSLYMDPETASSNRLKPEVVAVGEEITTTISSYPWIGAGFRGTSLSAPIVAGEAALMMQRKDWLRYSPEAVKAGVMATARWTWLKENRDSDQRASVDKMGVGAVDTTAAYNSLVNGRIQGLYLHKGDFNEGHYDIDFEVTVPERIRVIIVWSSHPSRVGITNWVLHDRLESDFDLAVISPHGQVFGSYADEANYEIVEFIAQETGDYRARIYLSRWDDSSMEERVGFAWYSGIPLTWIE